MVKTSDFKNKRTLFSFLILPFLIFLFNNANAQTADLFISVSSDLSIAQINDNVVFTVNVKNSGPNIATNTRVTDVLPSGYTFISAVPSVGTFSDPIWTNWELACEWYGFNYYNITTSTYVT